MAVAAGRRYRWGVSEKSRESEEPLQSAPAELAPVERVPAPGPAMPHSPGRPPRSRRRVWAARFVALGADVTQIALLPLLFAGAISPVDDVIDVVTALLLTWLIGWHWAFLPTFVAELVPFVDLVPTWTFAAFLATRGRDRDLTAP